MSEFKTPSEILGGLHSGALSRNGAFDLFSRPEARRAHIAYNRLIALVAELRLPGVIFSSKAGTGPFELEVEVSRLGYRHTMKLNRWEKEFFLGELGGDRLLGGKV